MAHSMGSTSVVFLTTLITLIITSAHAATVPVNATLQLPAFNSVRSCLPFTFLVLPPSATSTNTSTATITADAHVINATVLTVDSNGVLVLTVLHGFKTNNAIKLTIIPATNSSLQSLQNDGPGDLILGPGSNVPSLAVVTTGIGNLLGYDISAASVAATSSGIGTIMLNGTFGGGSVTTSGTGKVYLVGSVDGLVQIDAGGITSVFVEGTPSAVIQGTVQGMSKVLYTQGTCSVLPQFASLFSNVFGNPCQQVFGPGDLGFGSTWTCGLVVDGYSHCAVPTGGLVQPATTAIPWMQTDGAAVASLPPPKHIGMHRSPPGYGAHPSIKPINRDVISSSSSGNGGTSFSSSSSSNPGEGGTTMTSSSQNGGPAVVTVNGQVVSPDMSQDQGQGLPQNSNGLAIASITCNDLSPLQVLD